MKVAGPGTILWDKACSLVWQWLDFHPSIECSRLAQLDLTERISKAMVDECERCARIVDAECQRILSKQDDELHEQVNVNIRLVAMTLPDIAAAIRGKP